MFTVDLNFSRIFNFDQVVEGNGVDKESRHIFRFGGVYVETVCHNRSFHVSSSVIKIKSNYWGKS